VGAGQMTVDTDERRLERMIANLVVNAFQETPPGGSIRIGLATDRSKRQMATLSIEDEAGSAACERLTAAFHASEGGGLGLRVVAALAEALNATVRIERTQHGSRVEILLSSMRSPHRTATISSL
ncbi:MAG: ATP-binding protein, partial [Candidatus Eremiobacteraeota bacterium]|nr:ATP-binding protein [Candidatus Eremiobacteraeota bacterium]